VNFGLFSGQSEVQRTALILIALGISAVVAFWALRQGSGRLTPVAAGLLIGGALGNALDRMIYGAVVDFLNMSCCGIENPFVFNLADVAIFLGAIGLMFAPQPQDPTIADRDKNG
jgi:signal peptidase II